MGERGAEELEKRTREKDSVLLTSPSGRAYRVTDSMYTIVVS